MSLLLNASLQDSLGSFINQTDRKWTKIVRSWIDQKKTKNGPKMDGKRTKNGQKMEKNGQNKPFRVNKYPGLRCAQKCQKCYFKVGWVANGFKILPGHLFCVQFLPYQLLQSQASHMVPVLKNNSIADYSSSLHNTFLL